MAKPKEWTLAEQSYEVLGRIVPQDVRDQAAQEIMGSNLADQEALCAAALRAVQHFADFFEQEFRGRPEITPAATKEAGIYMTLGIVEEFKKVALMCMGGFSPDIEPGEPIVRH